MTTSRGIDLGPTFSGEAAYLDSILQTRDDLVARRIPLGNAFLDDCLGGIYPDDFIIIGAGPGVGKTALVTGTLDAALEAGIDPVHALMLEAAPGEVAARMAYKELAIRSSKKMDFADFWRGRVLGEEQEHWAAITEKLRPKLTRLHTLYKKGGDFTPTTLGKVLAGIQNTTQFVVLDHIHVIDGDNDREIATQVKTVELLCAMALVHHKPVIAASHVKKAQNNEWRLVPTKEDLYGSRHISGKATVIIMAARDWQGERPDKWLSPTFFTVDKDRRGRASPYVARVNYDIARGVYEDMYVLGRAVKKGKDGQSWEPLPEAILPEWAVRDMRRIERRPF